MIRHVVSKFKRKTSTKDEEVARDFVVRTKNTFVDVLVLDEGAVAADVTRFDLGDLLLI